MTWLAVACKAARLVTTPIQRLLRKYMFDAAHQRVALQATANGAMLHCLYFASKNEITENAT